MAERLAHVAGAELGRVLFYDKRLSGNLTTSIGRAHGKSAAQIALKWIVQRGIAVVTKSSSLAHLKQDIDLFDFNLTSAELAALNAATFASADTPSFMCDDK